MGEEITNIWEVDIGNCKLDTSLARRQLVAEEACLQTCGDQSSQSLGRA